VTIVAELFPLVMVLRRVLTYYGAIVAEIIDKRDKERGGDQWHSKQGMVFKFHVGVLMICSNQKYVA
jgi:hypothetical protein